MIRRGFRPGILRWLLVAILAAFNLSGCVSAPRVHTSPHEATRVPYTTQVFFAVDKDSPLRHMSGFEVRVREIWRTWAVPESDWAAADYLQCCVVAGLYEVAPVGNLAVTVLLGTTEQQIAGGTARVALARDTAYWFHLYISEHDPMYGCMGCAGKESYLLDPKLGFPPDYRLWIVYGWNWISRPVVF